MLVGGQCSRGRHNVPGCRVWSVLWRHGRCCGRTQHLDSEEGWEQGETHTGPSKTQGTLRKHYFAVCKLKKNLIFLYEFLHFAKWSSSRVGNIHSSTDSSAKYLIPRLLLLPGRAVAPCVCTTVGVHWASHLLQIPSLSLGEEEVRVV